MLKKILQTAFLYMIIFILIISLLAGIIIYNNDKSYENQLLNVCKQQESSTFIENTSDITSINQTTITQPSKSHTEKITQPYYNSDTVAYIKIINSNLQSPVVQYIDNEYYLTHNYFNKKSKNGAIFVDYRNDIYNLSDNTVIYGHNMKTGTLFGNLIKYYSSASSYKKYPLIEMNINNELSYWKVFACFYTNSIAQDDNGYIFPYTMIDMNETQMNEFISEIKKRSLINTDIDVSYPDKLLTLSTCSYSFDNGRFVVVARQVRDNESPNVNLSAVKNNPSPKYPQIYYDIKRKENPYKNDIPWYPK